MLATNPPRLLTHKARQAVCQASKTPPVYPTTNTDSGISTKIRCWPHCCPHLWTHLALARRLALCLDLLVPVVRHTRLPVHGGALCRDDDVEPPVVAGLLHAPRVGDWGFMVGMYIKINGYIKL